MRDLAAALALALMLFAPSARADEVAFQHVTVVDVVQRRLVPDQVVRISGERIVEVAPAASARIPKATRVIDAKGKFLIPGLWDMHMIHRPGRERAFTFPPNHWTMEVKK
jgi:imidazolonepropionase-like amidohydrolase